MPVDSREYEMICTNCLKPIVEVSENRFAHVDGTKTKHPVRPKRRYKESGVVEYFDYVSKESEQRL